MRGDSGREEGWHNDEPRAAAILTTSAAAAVAPMQLRDRKNEGGRSRYLHTAFHFVCDGKVVPLEGQHVASVYSRKPYRALHDARLGDFNRPLDAGDSGERG